MSSGFLDAPLPLAFAHRGFTDGDGTENSMAAFQRAVDLGYRYLETDVRVTRDGVALAFHDARLDRVTDRTGRIDELTYAEVRTARIAGREPIPLLTDVLATWPDARINLDVKSEASVAATADAVRRTNSLDRICVGSFSDARIEATRRLLGPQLCTSIGPRAAFGLRMASRLGRRLRPTPARCAQVPARLGRVTFVDARFLATAHTAGLQVHVWTINDPVEMRQLLDLGVDGVMTDRADLLRDELARRGSWAG